MSLGLGRSGLGEFEGKVSGVERERSSVRKAVWMEGCKESSCMR